MATLRYPILLNGLETRLCFRNSVSLTYPENKPGNLMVKPNSIVTENQLWEHCYTFLNLINYGNLWN